MVVGSFLLPKKRVSGKETAYNQVESQNLALLVFEYATTHVDESNKDQIEEFILVELK